MAIYYLCPDLDVKSAGVRTVYRHVAVLTAHQIPAAVMHGKEGFGLNDVPNVPVRYFNTFGGFAAGDVVVIPEVSGGLMRALKDLPIRRMVLALNWDAAFNRGAGVFDYQSLGIERVLTHSPAIGELMAWNMKLPTYVFKWGIRPDLYFESAGRRREIVYIERKQDRVEALRTVLYARNRRFVEEVTWTGLDGLPETQYAAAIREASVFLNMSRAEGLPCSILEAMRSGTLVAGYSSIGGQRELIGEGPGQNMILVETMDYPALARKLEPVLEGVLRGDLSEYAPVIRNAMKTSEAYTLEAEEASILSMWREFLGMGRAENQAIS